MVICRLAGYFRRTQVLGTPCTRLLTDRLQLWSPELEVEKNGGRESEAEQRQQAFEAHGSRPAFEKASHFLGVSPVTGALTGRPPEPNLNTQATGSLLVLPPLLAQENSAGEMRSNSADSHVDSRRA